MWGMYMIKTNVIFQNNSSEQRSNAWVIIQCEGYLHVEEKCIHS